jgi:hypothetical protein
MSAANSHIAEMQRTLQQLQVCVCLKMRAKSLQEQQRQAERLNDNCRRDLEEQGATNEELSSEMQASNKCL